MDSVEEFGSTGNVQSDKDIINYNPKIVLKKLELDRKIKKSSSQTRSKSQSPSSIKSSYAKTNLKPLDHPKCFTNIENFNLINKNKENNHSLLTKSVYEAEKENSGPSILNCNNRSNDQIKTLESVVTPAALELSQTLKFNEQIDQCQKRDTFELCSNAQEKNSQSEDESSDDYYLNPTKKFGTANLKRKSLAIQSSEDESKNVKSSNKETHNINSDDSWFKKSEEREKKRKKTLRKRQPSNAIGSSDDDSDKQQELEDPKVVDELEDNDLGKQQELEDPEVVGEVEDDDLGKQKKLDGSEVDSEVEDDDSDEAHYSTDHSNADDGVDSVDQNTSNNLQLTVPDSIHNDVEENSDASDEAQQGVSDPMLNKDKVDIIPEIPDLANGALQAVLDSILNNVDGNVALPDVDDDAQQEVPNPIPDRVEVDLNPANGAIQALLEEEQEDQGAPHNPMLVPPPEEEPVLDEIEVDETNPYGLIEAYAYRCYLRLKKLKLFLPAYEEPLERYEEYVRNGKTFVYLGCGIAVGFKTWTKTKRRNKISLFSTEVSRLIFKKDLCNICLDDTKAHRQVPNLPKRSLPCARKLQLYISICRDYLRTNRCYMNLPSTEHDSHLLACTSRLSPGTRNARNRALKELEKN
ncbi:hypothetical protein TKK_0019529 [Trichogramma kaykai]